MLMMSSSHADLLLLVVLLLNLYVLATSRMSVAVKTVAVQGGALALLPLMLLDEPNDVITVHLIAIAVGTLALKAFVIPALLLRSMRVAKVTREVEPYVSLHTSVLLGAALTAVAFWMASALKLPRPAPSALTVPVALATLFVGFLVVVTRRKAVTQVLGYLMLENGIYIFGQCLTTEMPFLVELGILLDVLVGVFVMGIAIHHISREFDAIDTDALTSLKD